MKQAALRAARGAGVAVFALFLSTGALAQGRPQFFSQPPSVARAANAPGIVSQAAPVRFNAAAMKGLKHLDEFEVRLPNGLAHTAVLDLATDHGGGIVSLVGRLKDRGNHYRVIITTGPGGSFGVVDTPEGSFRIVPGGNHDWLVDMALEQPHLPAPPMENDGFAVDVASKSVVTDPSRAALGTAVTGVNNVADAKLLPTPQATIDMLFVVTRGLANRLGGTLATRLNFLVTRANTSYSDSEIAITLRMVNFTVVDFPDGGDDGLALHSITPFCTPGNPSCGGENFDAAVFGNIEALRTQYGADMVSFLRNGGGLGGSGVAWLPSSPSAGLMYSTMQGCVTGCESVWIHEVGHNMGNSHDRATSEWQGWVDTSNGGPPVYVQTYSPAGSSFGYAFCKSGALRCNPALAPNAGGCAANTQPECAPGTVDPSNFSDIMSYFHASTARLYKFSSSSATVSCVAPGGDGAIRACGIAEGLANAADTASGMNNNRAAISALKATTVTNLPGALQFSATGFSAPEGGTMTFTVSRVGGSSGAVSVNYAVTGNTATAGTDFTVAAGTLNWANGDTADKTFNVTIANDGIAEGVESLTATLSAPAGATGVYLGYPTSAVGLILADFGGTVGGALPSGFTSTNWTVANDFARDGLTSLRSAQVTGPGDFVTFGNSDLTYTGNLPAGVIAFAYRVSSYDGFGALDFSVNGTTVLSVGNTASVGDGPTAGWRLFFYTVTVAGPHTLQWRYKNLLPDPCSNYVQPLGAACADRAWIDAVSLPAAAPGQFALTVAKSGTGAGTVTSAPAGINCGATCVFSYDSGTAVTLTAAPTTGSVFGGWSGGGCSGTGTCQVTLAAATTVTATFTLSPVQFALTVSKAGTGLGTVTSSPTGINCGVTCVFSYNSGTAVTLTAAPTAGSIFAGWSGGGCTGTGTCQVTVAAATAVTATFTLTVGVPLGSPSPANVDFGGQSMRTTSIVTPVILTNVGTGTLSVTSVSVSSAAFGQTNSCTTLAAAASCTINVTFTPSTQGAVSGNLTVQTSAGTVTVPLAGIGERSLVTHYYRSILRRAPDGPGKTFWEAEATRVGGLGANVNETWYSMAMSFYFSTEYTLLNRDNSGFITDLYNTFFNRAPDSGGFNFWLTQMAGGMPREGVLANFMFSPEFSLFTQAIFGNTTARGEVNVVVDFYRGLLSRLPDSGGFNFYVGQFRTAQCQGAGQVYTQVENISSGYANSTEYSNRGRSNLQYVADLYNAFLRRGPDLGGIQFWTSQITTGARTREQVRQEFKVSPEFNLRVNSILGETCIQ